MVLLVVAEELPVAVAHLEEHQEGEEARSVEREAEYVEGHEVDSVLGELQEGRVLGSKVAVEVEIFGS